MLELLTRHPEWALYFASLAVLSLFVTIEGSYAARFRPALYRRRDTLCNLEMYAGSFVINLFWAGVVYALYSKVHEYSLWKLGRQWWLFEGDTPLWQWVTLFLLEDLTFYAFHRSSHRIRALWASHVNHHSSSRFNLTTALRQTWTPFLAVVFWLPLPFLGFDPLMVMTLQALSLTYQSWIHTELVSDLGPWGWVFNTPAHHQVHHGTARKYVDRNFGGVLIVWDRWLGTFQPLEEPATYGLGDGIERDQPLQVAFHEWGALLRDLREARSIREWPALLIGISEGKK